MPPAERPYVCSSGAVVRCHGVLGCFNVPGVRMLADVYPNTFHHTINDNQCASAAVGEVSPPRPRPAHLLGTTRSSCKKAQVARMCCLRCLVDHAGDGWLCIDKKPSSAGGCSNLQLGCDILAAGAWLILG